MKVLITGGAGFIGSHLVSKLVKLGYDVTVIDNLSSGFKKNLEDVEDKIKVVELDVCSEKIADYSKGQDVIFHLAAIPILNLVMSILKKHSNLMLRALSMFYFQQQKMV
jgi:UDP-glucose 4-epimerase